MSRWLWMVVSLALFLLFPLLFRPITEGYCSIGTYGWHLTLLGLSLILLSGLLWKERAQNQGVSEEQRRRRRVRRGILGGIAGLVVLAFSGDVLWRTSNMYGALFTISTVDANFPNGFPGPVVWAPDGQHLLMTNSDTFQVWDVLARKKIRSVKHQQYVLVNGQFIGLVPTTDLSLAWSPNQRFVAVVANSSAQVFEIASGKRLSHWSADLRWTAVSWSMDSQQVATIAHSNTARSTVEVHDAITGQLVRSFPPPPRRSSRGEPTYSAISWSPEKQLLAAVGREEDDFIAGVPGAVFFTIWSIASGELLFTTSSDPEDDLHHDSPGSITIAWSSDGKQFALMSNALGVRLWMLADGGGIQPQPLMTYIGSGGPYSQLAWSPENRYIALGDGDQREANVVRIFEATTGQTRLSYRGHAGFISGLSWSPRGNYIASSSDDGVRVWQPEL